MPLPFPVTPMNPAYGYLLPRPYHYAVHEGFFSLERPVRVGEGLEQIADRLRFFGAMVSADAAAAIDLVAGAGLPPEGFTLEVTPDRIVLKAGDAAGRLYGAHALEQLLWIAFRWGANAAQLECGVVQDRPRYRWRGLMLDSARHFQDRETILATLRLMGKLRLNRFHWHLTDAQSWRIPAKGAPELNGHGDWQDGAYTPEDFVAIRAEAARQCIEILPEIDMPGHNVFLLGLHPELRCNPEVHGWEICLANPASMEFMKARLLEALELLPECKVVHIGDDECGTSHWDKCPKCQAKIRELGLKDSRALEEWFVNEICNFLLAHGRTPMVWGTHINPPKQTILQGWGNECDMVTCAAHDDNPVVSSIDHAYYLDYPQDDEDPHSDPMTPVTDMDTYCSTVGAHMVEYLGDRLLGAEAPLWTELVPQWRVRVKFLDRAIALSEATWSQQCHKHYRNFLQRKRGLELAGYTW